MKKHILFIMVLLITLLVSASAFAVHLPTPPSVPPQLAADVPLPAHTVPVITNVQVSGNDITVDAAGTFNDGGVIIFISTPAGETQQYVMLAVTASGLSGTVSLPADATGWELSMVSLYNTSDPDVNMYFHYDEEGALSSYSIQESAAFLQYSFNSQGNLFGYYTETLSAYYTEEGYLNNYTVHTAAGYQEYDAQNQLITDVSTDPVTGTATRLFYDDGVLVCREIDNTDGSRYLYDAQGILRQSMVQNAGGTIMVNVYDVNGNLNTYEVQSFTQYERFDAAGNLLRRSTLVDGSRVYEEFENGQQVFKWVSGELPDGRRYEDEYENGVYTKRILYEEDGEYSYDPDGNYLGKTVYYGDEWEEYNAANQLTEYSVYSDQQGGVWLTYNHRRKLLTVEYYEPYFHGSYMYDTEEKQWYFNGVPYNGPVPIVLSALSLEKEIVWYPNNTVCSFGPQFRVVKPGLTDKWYMFTPIDLSKDGTQTFELIGGSVYVLGQVHVTVSGDSVTVTYDTVKGKNGHIYMKSEYLNFFKDINSVTTVDPEQLGGGFKFGQTISIQKDLGGDLSVLMFVRNVATFRNLVDNGTPLRRFYKNLPSRVTQRDAMLELMD